MAPPLWYKCPLSSYATAMGCPILKACRYTTTSAPPIDRHARYDTSGTTPLPAHSRMGVRCCTPLSLLSFHANCCANTPLFYPLATRCLVLKHAMPLHHFCYGMSGTKLGYAGTRRVVYARGRGGLSARRYAVLPTSDSTLAHTCRTT
eukprot:1480505-Rhodomonas_salina.1